MAFNVPTGLSRPEGTSWLADARGSYDAIPDRTTPLVLLHSPGTHAPLHYATPRAARVSKRLVVPPVQPLADARGSYDAIPDRTPPSYCCTPPGTHAPSHYATPRPAPVKQRLAPFPIAHPPRTAALPREHPRLYITPRHEPRA